MNTASATPAYGRDYRSKAEVLKDFLEGKNFRLQNLYSSPYFSILDVYAAASTPGEKVRHPEWPYTHINFRYAKQRKVCVFDVEKQKMT